MNQTLTIDDDSLKSNKKLINFYSSICNNRSNIFPPYYAYILASMSSHPFDIDPCHHLYHPGHQNNSNKLCMERSWEKDVYLQMTQICPSQWQHYFSHWEYGREAQHYHQENGSVGTSNRLRIPYHKDRLDLFWFIFLAVSKNARFVEPLEKISIDIR